MSLAIARFSFLQMSILNGFFSLSSEANKAKRAEDQETTEGVVSSLTPELTLEINDEELIALKKQWLLDWEPYEKQIKALQDENEEYWLGKQHPGVLSKATERPLVDNVIFESLETFLPNATKQNPEPMVECDDEALGKAVQKKLADLADTLRMKLQLKKVARFWALYLLGAVKTAFDPDTNDISLVTVRPQRLILQPDATIDENMEYTGQYIGEYREAAASKLIALYPKKKQFITDKVKGKLGTMVRYIEWWTDDYIFWTLDNEVLAKAQNPHWNYEQQSIATDKFGNEIPQTLPGLNHFSIPKKPYVFLSIFNLGKHPHDDTSLITQNLAQQDLVNKRHRQIDKNADWMNGGWAVSGDRSGLSKEEAKQAIDAARNGGGIYIPSGNVGEAVTRMVGAPLPPDVFSQQVDTRNRILDVFGVRGSTPQSIMNEKTVRGKILAKSSDGDRTSFITEYLEQFSDQVFNWFIQFLYVYKPDEFQFGPRLIASVKEGSLIPKDSLTKANQAVELASAQLLDPLTLYERLEFPNPLETAKRLYMWTNAPALLFQNDPEVAQVEAAKQAQAAAEMQAKQPGQEQATNSEPAEPPAAPQLSDVPIQ